MNNSQRINKSAASVGGIKGLTRIALFVAMLAVSSYIAFPIPLSPAPVSAQTLVINLFALILSPRQTFKVMMVYLVAGAIGIPVFARGSSGLGVLAGPSGGFLFGLFAAAVLMSAFKDLWRGEKSFKRYLLVTLSGIPIIYFFGGIWMMRVISIDLRMIWSAAVLPFLPGDIFKCVAASLLASALGKAVKY